MAGLGDILTQYRTNIVTDSDLTNLPATQGLDDLPASKLHQTFKLSIDSGGSLGATHGGASLVEYLWVLRVEVYWAYQVDEEAIWNTIGTDLEAVSKAMLSDSNKNAGTVIVNPSGLWSFEQDNTWIKGTGTYEVRYRITQDLT